MSRTAADSIPRRRIVTALMLLANAAGAMLMQLIVVPRLGWSPRTLLRAGMTLALVALACLTIAPLLWALAVSTFAMGIASGMASPGYSAGASLAVSAREQGGIAGVINATGAHTLRFLPPLICASDDVDALVGVLEHVL